MTAFSKNYEIPCFSVKEVFQTIRLHLVLVVKSSKLLPKYPTKLNDYCEKSPKDGWIGNGGMKDILFLVCFYNFLVMNYLTSLFLKMVLLWYLFL